MSLRLQLLLLQGLIVGIVVAVTGLAAGAIQERQLRNAYLDQMVGVAQSVATLPAIVEAYGTDDPSAIIQPVAEVIRNASGVTYVVVTDAAGIRYSHPDPARIGERVSTDPSIPLSGEVFVGTQTGTLGESWRVKVPVFAADGDVIGSVSVGVLESTLRDEFAGYLPLLVAFMCAAALIGVLGAAGVASFIRRRFHRLEPREIAGLVGSRETMLHGMSEGVVAVDKAGVITLVNDAAGELLGREATALVGRRSAEVLDESLLAVLDDGEAEGRLVLAGERVLVARSTGRQSAPKDGATLLIRDHTELHALLVEMDGAHSIAGGLRAQAHEFANKLHVISGLLDVGLADDARAFIADSSSGGSIAIGEEFADQPELGALLMVKSSQARERGIRLDAFRRGVGALEMDLSERARSDILTVVGNLVDNAIEACRTGERVTVEMLVDATELRVVVDDDGLGLAPGSEEAIFAEGVTTKTGAADDRRGRGIGLALVSRIVHRYRGSVVAGASDDGGARFEVVLPLAGLMSEKRADRVVRA